MTLEPYQNSTAAALYDLFNPWGPDCDFYLQIAQESSRGIADFCCGTGLLTTRIAKDNGPVTGVDAALEMLDIARRREGASQVQWHTADVRTIALGQTFDRILCTGHAFQCFLTDTDQTALLDNMRRHLRPNGILVFETRNPGRRAWEDWNRNRSRTVIDPGFGEVQLRHDVKLVDKHLVHFDSEFLLVETAESVTVSSSLRFTDEVDLRERLRKTGFNIRAVYGDWDRSNVQNNSPELIFLAERV
jgi:ubiquinone/menaquinone biosynthesis C-methylase UbiE